jgi:AbrB family looped-hinge helix DNA binding protein
MQNIGENIMSLVKVKNKFQITIPTKVRDEVHIKEGDFLEIKAKGETIDYCYNTESNCRPREC